MKLNPKSQAILVLTYIFLALGIFAKAYYYQVLSNPYLVNDDDLQQLFCFYKLDRKSFAEASPVARYYLDLLPLGYKSIYKIAIHLGLDPIYFSKLLTAFLFLVTSIIALLLGYKLANWNGAIFMFTAVFICEGFFERMAGGLARSFGYPMAFLFIYGVFAQDARWIIIALIGSALFYPPLTFFMALYTGLMFLFPHWLEVFPLSKWNFFRRFVCLILVGFICLICLTPPLLGSIRWGPMHTPRQMQQMPEMQTDGRYDFSDRTPSPSIFQSLDIARYKVFRIFNRPHAKGQIFLTDRYGGIFLLSCLLPYFACPLTSLTSLTTLWMLLIILYEIGAWFYPRLYIPSRFVLFFMPILTLVGITLGFKQIAKRINPNWYLGPLGLLIAILGLLYAPSGGSGFNDNFKAFAPLYQKIQKLPEDTVIAGWPDPVLDAVPLFGHRPILAGYEIYQLFHYRYLDMMRKRMTANLQILFTDEPKTFSYFVQKYHVKYILFPEHIYQNCQHLRIFNPFTQMAIKLCQHTKKPVADNLPYVWRGKGYKLVEIR